MSNTCITYLNIVGPNQEIIPLYNNLNKWNDSGILRTLLDNAGFNHDNYKCCGEIIYILLKKEGDNNSYIDINTETAWVPMIRMWKDIAAKYAPNSKVYWMAEEPGFDIFETNDIHYDRFEDDYVIDWCFEESPFKTEDLRNKFNSEIESYSEPEFIYMFEEEFGTKNPDVIMRKLEELGNELEDGYLNIHKYDRDVFDDVD